MARYKKINQNQVAQANARIDELNFASAKLEELNKFTASEEFETLSDADKMDIAIEIHSLAALWNAVASRLERQGVELVEEDA